MSQVETYNYRIPFIPMKPHKRMHLKGLPELEAHIEELVISLHRDVFDQNCEALCKNPGYIIAVLTVNGECIRITSKDTDDTQEVILAGNKTYTFRGLRYQIINYDPAHIHLIFSVAVGIK